MYLHMSTNVSTEHFSTMEWLCIHSFKWTRTSPHKYGVICDKDIAIFSSRGFLNSLSFLFCLLYVFAKVFYISCKGMPWMELFDNKVHVLGTHPLLVFHHPCYYFYYYPHYFVSSRSVHFSHMSENAAMVLFLTSEQASLQLTRIFFIFSSVFLIWKTRVYDLVLWPI